MVAAPATILDAPRSPARVPRSNAAAPRVNWNAPRLKMNASPWKRKTSRLKWVASRTQKNTSRSPPIAPRLKMIAARLKRGHIVERDGTPASEDPHGGVHPHRIPVSSGTVGMTPTLRDSSRFSALLVPQLDPSRFSAPTALAPTSNPTTSRVKRTAPRSKKTACRLKGAAAVKHDDAAIEASRIAGAINYVGKRRRSGSDGKLTRTWPLCSPCRDATRRIAAARFIATGGVGTRKDRLNVRGKLGTMLARSRHGHRIID